MPILTAAVSKTRLLAVEAALPVSAVVSRRKSVYDLTAAEINDLRTAFRELQKIPDDRGYQYIAGIHGYPLPVYCQHGTAFFAVWHRPYLLLIEKALQAVVPSVALAYWDWTDPRAQAEGVPKIYTDETYTDPATNQVVMNPLYSEPITFAGTESDHTSREPASPADLINMSAMVDIAMRSGDYVTFSRNLENPHNAIHGWVGGTMGVVPYAAYDPLFWAHHANVDRLFWQWQTLHAGLVPPPQIMNAVLAPFNATVNTIWNIKGLGYQYVASPVAQVGTGAQGLLAGDMAGQHVFTEFSIEGVRKRFARGELHFEGMKHPKDSFEIRIFLNQTDAGPTTPTTGNPHYGGSLFLFGHGECGGGEGHCDVPSLEQQDLFDPRPPHHLTPMHLTLDIAEALAVLLEENAKIMQITLVALDFAGKPVAASEIDFDSLTLVAD